MSSLAERMVALHYATKKPPQPNATTSAITYKPANKRKSKKKKGTSAKKKKKDIKDPKWWTRDFGSRSSGFHDPFAEPKASLRAAEKSHPE